MIDFSGKNWTANAPRTLVTCEDGRTMAIDPAMTDAYVMGVVQQLHDAEMAAATRSAADALAGNAVKADTTIKYLLTHTPAEIDAYVTASATNLATAVGLLSKLAQAVSVLGKQALR